MPINTEPGSTGWWLRQLGQQLDSQVPELERLKNYDNGDHPLPEGHRRAKASYQRFQLQSRTNFAGLVSEAVIDRLNVIGFRMGGIAGLEADAFANLVWQENQMDADQVLVMHNALVMRRGYVLVGQADDTQSGVLLTSEDPRNVIHAADPANPRLLRAALKTWTDDVTRSRYAVVYEPETVTYFVAPSKEGLFSSSFGLWELDETEGENGVSDNPLAPTIPIVCFRNRPEKILTGFGEAEDVLDIQDRINQVILDRLVTGTTQAFRQRWVTGIDLDNTTFDPGADLIWSVDDTEAKFGDFTTADIRQFIEAAKSDVENMASISRTPPYYLLGAMVNLSGEALTAAESGLVAKSKRRMGQFGESWEQVMGLAFKLTGREVSVDAETIWADPERKNDAASADAAVKKKDVGVPWRQLMEDLGYTPAQVARMETLRASDALQSALLQPPVPVATPGPTGPAPEEMTGPETTGTMQPITRANAS